MTFEIDKLIEVSLKNNDDNFLKVRETLTRIGVASRSKKELYQSCHILHKQGRYYIVHFKEMFALDGKPSNMDEKDYGRRNTIANLLEEWGLVTILNKEVADEPRAPIQHIQILPFKEKDEWTLVTKYNIGNTK